MTMNSKQLKKFVTKFREGILQGRSPDSMCFAVCWPLMGVLWGMGIHCDMLTFQFPHSNHVILSVNGIIIDPTADQFKHLDPSLDGVVVGPMPEIYWQWIAEGGQEIPRKIKTKKRKKKS